MLCRSPTFSWVNDGSIGHAVTKIQCQVLSLCISFVVCTSIVIYVRRDKLLPYVRLLLGGICGKPLSQLLCSYEVAHSYCCVSRYGWTLPIYVDITFTIFDIFCYFLTFYCLYSAILVALLNKWRRFFEGCLTMHLPNEIKWNTNLMQLGNFIDVFLARRVSGTHAHH